MEIQDGKGSLSAPSQTIPGEILCDISHQDLRPQEDYNNTSERTASGSAGDLSPAKSLGYEALDSKFKENDSLSVQQVTTRSSCSNDEVYGKTGNEMISDEVTPQLPKSPLLRCVCKKRACGGVGESMSLSDLPSCCRETVIERLESAMWKDGKKYVHGALRAWIQKGKLPPCTQEYFDDGEPAITSTRDENEGKANPTLEGEGSVFTVCSRKRCRDVSEPIYEQDFLDGNLEIINFITTKEHDGKLFILSTLRAWLPASKLPDCYKSPLLGQRTYKRRKTAKA